MNSDHGNPFTTSETPARQPIRATPFVWRDPSTIPPRKWLYGSHYIREYLSVTVAPGGIGKSSLVLAEVIAMVTGRPLLGITSAEKVNAWYINLEDPLDEIERRIAAICLHYKIDPSELAGRLFVDFGRDCPVVVAVETKDGAKIVQPVVDELTAELLAHEIGLLIVDPFVSSHEVSENDNNKITTVKNIFAGIASATSAAVELIHHTRKGTSGQTGDYNVDDARGAGALVFGARSARVLNAMTKEQGVSAGIENPWFYFNVSIGKANLAPRPDKADWYRMAGVPLGNGGLLNAFDQGDNIGVATAWTWPDAMATVKVDHLRKTQQLVKQGSYRENQQAKEWVGRAVAEAMGLDHADKANQRIIKAALKKWFETGMLVKVEKEDAHRERKLFVEVGEWATD